MRDTVDLGAFGIYVLERFFSKLERAILFRTWGGLSSMLPKGGEEIWGTENQAPDDHDDIEETFGSMLTIRSLIKKKDNNNSTNSSEKSEKIIRHSCKSGVDLLHKSTTDTFSEMLTRNYSFGIVANEKQMQDIKEDRTKWTNVLESQLPNAPDMKIYCLYGYGKETERKYFYSNEQEINDDDDNDFGDKLRDLFRHIFIDSSMNSETDPKIKRGIHN